MTVLICLLSLAPYLGMGQDNANPLVLQVTEIWDASNAEWIYSRKYVNEYDDQQRLIRHNLSLWQTEDKIWCTDEERFYTYGEIYHERKIWLYKCGFEGFAKFVYRDEADTGLRVYSEERQEWPDANYQHWIRSSLLVMDDSTFSQNTIEQFDFDTGTWEVLGVNTARTTYNENNCLVESVTSSSGGFLRRTTYTVDALCRPIAVVRSVRPGTDEDEQIESIDSTFYSGDTTWTKYYSPDNNGELVLHSLFIRPTQERRWEEHFFMQDDYNGPGYGGRSRIEYDTNGFQTYVIVELRTDDDTSWQLVHEVIEEYSDFMKPLYRVWRDVYIDSLDAWQSETSISYQYNDRDLEDEQVRITREIDSTGMVVATSQVLMSDYEYYCQELPRQRIIREDGVNKYRYSFSYLHPLECEDSPGAGMNIFPNPATDWLLIRSPLAEDGNTMLHVLSTNGKTHRKFSLDFLAGYAETNIGDLPAGTYFIWVQEPGAGRGEVHKLVKIDR